VAVCRSKEDWDRFTESREYNSINSLDDSILKKHRGIQNWTLAGYSNPAKHTVDFIVDMQYAAERNGESVPNIRERLVCPITGLNNRQRLMATLIEDRLKLLKRQNVYMMEQITPLFKWTASTLNGHNFIGSEYIGNQYASGQEINGVRHEDVERLSFSDNYFDLIISTDVLEHIPSPQKGLSECSRVLKTGGHMLLTIPFLPNMEQSICRARIENGDMVLLLPEQYHGNPMSEKGSLVFTDFGWDFLTCGRESGFSESCMEIYHSVEFGHLWPQMIFRFIK